MKRIEGPSANLPLNIHQRQNYIWKVWNTRKTTGTACIFHANNGFSCNTQYFTHCGKGHHIWIGERKWEFSKMDWNSELLLQKPQIQIIFGHSKFNIGVTQEFETNPSQITTYSHYLFIYPHSKFFIFSHRFINFN